MKRGESGLSLLVAIDKEKGMSSHDVVNRVRRIFGERRVGHTGTLDPLATGVLPLCIGPATRLDQYMTGHDKCYRVTIAFGWETTTDDAEGAPTVTGAPPSSLYDEDFAREYVLGLVGAREQVPPQYSAIKVEGKRAYQLARAGQQAELEARPIEVHQASLASLAADDATDMPLWSVDLSVSKGTYIRALARDIGRELGCPAHVSALQRRVAGTITLADCVSLDTLEALGADAAIDPVAVLAYRYAFGDAHVKQIDAGAKVPADTFTLFEAPDPNKDERSCMCVSSVAPSPDKPKDGELVSVVVENRLKALYSYDVQANGWKPACVFSTGIARL